MPSTLKRMSSKVLLAFFCGLTLSTGSTSALSGRFFVFTKPDPTVQALLFSGRAEEGSRLPSKLLHSNALGF